MASDLQPGDHAPNFTLPTDGGGTVSLAALRGHPVVLYFYPKDNTSGCTLEAAAFSKAGRQFKAARAAVIGVSKDSVTFHDKFKAKYKLSITLGSDGDAKVARDYGVWTQKTLYGRRFMGMERATFLIDAKGVIRKIWRKVKVPGHVDDVLRTLSEI
ncbi:MAG: peroxiredoxin [Alphaproteobacteria bacterium]